MTDSRRSHTSSVPDVLLTDSRRSHTSSVPDVLVTDSRRSHTSAVPQWRCSPAWFFTVLLTELLSACDWMDRALPAACDWMDRALPAAVTEVAVPCSADAP